MKLEGNGLVFKKLKRVTGSSENDRNSTTPDKEIRLSSMVLFICVLNSTLSRLKLFPFLYTTLLVCNSFLFSAQLFRLVFMIPLPDFGAVDHVFFPASIQRRQQHLCLLCASSKMTWKGRPHHHLMAEILSLTQMAGMVC